MGDYSLDQTLAKVSNRLEELQEHQRLSRFDAVMFLAYPLITLIMTALATVSVQTENPIFQQIKFFDIWTPKNVLDVAYSPFILFVVGGFVYFVWSYLKDDLKGRALSVFFVVTGSSFITFGLLLSAVPWPLIGSETPEVPQNLAAVVTCVQWGYGLICIGFGAFLGAVLVALRTCSKFCIWLARNTPKMTVVAGLEPSQFWEPGLKKFVKWYWAAAFLPSYAVAVLLTIAVSLWTVGHVSDTITYHYWGLVALVVLTIQLM